MDEYKFIEKWSWLNLHERQLAIHPFKNIYRTRIYWLPDAKRCPTTAGERTVITQRIQNVLLFLKIRKGNILLKQYEGEDVYGGSANANGLSLFKTIVVDDDPAFRLYILAMQLQNADKELDSLIDKVGQDFIPEIYIVSEDYLKVICIYNGGIDLYTDEKTAQTLKSHFRQFLSPRDDML